MRTSRTFRVFFGVFVLIVFGIYSFMRFTTSPHSDDFDTENAYIYSEALARVRAEEAQAAQAAAQAAAQPLPTPEQIAEETAAPAEELPQETESDLPKIDINSWEFILVNDAHRLTGEDFPPQVVEVSDSRCPVDSRIADPLMAMAQACIDAGYPAYLSSGYRSYSEQAANFTRVCQNNGVADGKDANGFYITMPAGASEHQTGLCCDITDVYRPIKNASLADTDTFNWLNEHCTEYGFILRFPSDKQEITGVMYEPFHFRYVGVEAAKYIAENGLCLEEFIALYQETDTPTETGKTPAEPQSP